MINERLRVSGLGLAQGDSLSPGPLPRRHSNQERQAQTGAEKGAQPSELVRGQEAWRKFQSSGTRSGLLSAGRRWMWRGGRRSAWAETGASVKKSAIQGFRLCGMHLPTGSLPDHTQPSPRPPENRAHRAWGGPSEINGLPSVHMLCPCERSREFCVRIDCQQSLKFKALILNSEMLVISS